MKTVCTRCGTHFNWMNSGCVQDAWAKNNKHFYDVKCSCGEMKTIKLPDTFNYREK